MRIIFLVTIILCLVGCSEIPPKKKEKLPVCYLDTSNSVGYIQLVLVRVFLLNGEDEKTKIPINSTEEGIKLSKELNCQIR